MNNLQLTEMFTGSLVIKLTGLDTRHVYDPWSFRVTLAIVRVEFSSVVLIRILSLAVTSELSFIQRKEREDPEEEQNRLTELLNSIRSALSGETLTLETGSVGGKKSYHQTQQTTISIVNMNQLSTNLDIKRFKK